MTRLIRSLVVLFLLGLITLPLHVCPATAQDDPITIGFHAPRAGPLAAIGEDMVNGWELWWNHNENVIAGRSVETFHRDSGCKPSMALNNARKLVEQEDVDFLVGMLCANSGLAVSDYLKGKPVPLFLSVVAADNLTQRTRQPNVIRITSWASSQTMHPLGEWVAKNEKYGKQTITVGWDFAFGHESIGGFVNTFTDHGGEVVDQLWAPIGTADWSPYISTVIAKQPDFVTAITNGISSIKLVQQWSTYGLKGKIPLIGQGPLTAVSLLSAMDPQALGMRSVATYAEGREARPTQKFVEFYDATYGELPSFYAATNYTAAQWLVRAMKRLEGEVEDVDRFLKAVRNVTFQESPLGPMELDQYDNPLQNVYLREVRRRSDGRLWNVPIHTWRKVSQFWTYDPEEFLKQPVYSRDYQGINWP